MDRHQKVRNQIGVAAIDSGQVSSKLSARRSKNEFYRYYAGYPVEFASWALSELHLEPGARVLDPWNGSGTTAAACAQVGFAYQGLDINPVMVHLSRARVASISDIQKAGGLIDAIHRSFRNWEFISLFDVGDVFQGKKEFGDRAKSIALASLFPFVRDVLSGQKTKNPSWFKRNASLSGLVFNVDELFETWKLLLQNLGHWRGEFSENCASLISVDLGDSRKSLARRGIFDGVLTSPPYLTRLDYVQATLPEFLLLQALEGAPDTQKLRRSMLGSPLTSERPLGSRERLPIDVQDLLGRIEGHASKASSTYYLRFFSAYFVDLQVSIKNIARVLRSGAGACFVVQSSHYKEIEIDLGRAMVLLGGEFGLVLEKRYDFDSRRSMSFVNSRAHTDARKPKSECALFFRKE